MSEESVPGPGKARRSRWPWIVATVIVGVALVGASGAMLGRTTAPGPTIVVAPGPVVQQSPGASALPAMRPGIVAGAGSAAAVPAVFTAATDLADTPGVASGYQLTTGQVDGGELAGALASAFGITGDVAQTANGWIVGSTDGNVPTVTVTDDPLLSWHFEDPQALLGSTGVSINPDTAREQASTVLAAIGVDVSSVDWRVDRFADRTTVTAWQLLRGARTDLSWDVTLGKDGKVASANGFAAGLVEVPGYRVVGAATAVNRSNGPVWNDLGPVPVSPAPKTGAATPSPSSTSSAPTRPALQVPVARVLVEQAELGLAQFRQPDGAVLILPAYQITGADGSRWSVIAIGAEDVDFVAQSDPSATPASP